MGDIGRIGKAFFFFSDFFRSHFFRSLEPAARNGLKCFRREIRRLGVQEAAVPAIGLGMETATDLP